MRKLCLLIFLIILSFKSYASLSFDDHVEVYGKFFKTPKITKIIPKLNYGMKIASSEEMVFFDYSSKYKIKPKIKKIKQKKKIVRPKITKALKPLKTNGYVDYSSIIRSSYKKASAGSAKIKFQVFDRNKPIDLDNFELVPAYDKNDVINDQGMGHVELPLSKNSYSSIFRATLSSKDVVRTNFSINVISGETETVITMSHEKIDRILNFTKIKEQIGSYILVKLGDEIDSTRFHGRYQKKIYLSKRMNIVDPGSSYEYELYIDVEPGNSLLSFMNLQGKVAEKIVHIVEGELTFTSPSFIKTSYDQLEFFQTGIGNKINSKLNISDKNVRYFNTKKNSTIIGLNSVKVKVPLRVDNFRKYVELGSDLFVGFENNRKVVIPDDEYRSYIKHNLKLDEDDPSCIIHLNLDKSYTKITIDNSSAQYSGHLEFYYMDRDGSVSQEISSLTEHMIITSKDIGIINIKLDDGTSSKYMETFCSQSLYLIEQL